MKHRLSFTLIELIVVLGIVSMLLGLTALSLFSFSSGAALKLSAQKLVAALNLARSQAITTLVEHGVAIDPATERFFVFRKPDSDTREIVSQDYFCEKGCDLVSTSAPLDTNSVINLRAVVFNSNGSTEGVNCSVDITSVTGKSCTITILNTTGRLKLTYS